MRRFLSILALLAVTGVATGAAPQGLICTLTGKKIATCCCQTKDGKLYCPLAGKTINDCCCK